MHYSNYWENQTKDENQLPFGDMVSPDSTPQNDIQVIINGHRYKLS